MRHLISFFIPKIVEIEVAFSEGPIKTSANPCSAVMRFFQSLNCGLRLPRPFDSCILRIYEVLRGRPRHLLVSERHEGFKIGTGRILHRLCQYFGIVVVHITISCRNNSKAIRREEYLTVLRLFRSLLPEW